jgi:hypothetical protein
MYVFVFISSTKHIIIYVSIVLYFWALTKYNINLFIIMHDNLINTWLVNYKEKKISK